MGDFYKSLISLLLKYTIALIVVFVEQRSLEPASPLDFQEAGELKGDDLAAAQRILDERGVSGGKASWPQTSG